MPRFTYLKHRLLVQAPCIWRGEYALATSKLLANPCSLCLAPSSARSDALKLIHRLSRGLQNMVSNIIKLNRAIWKPSQFLCFDEIHLKMKTEYMRLKTWTCYLWSYASYTSRISSNRFLDLMNLGISNKVEQLLLAICKNISFSSDRNIL